VVLASAEEEVDGGWILPFHPKEATNKTETMLFEFVKRSWRPYLAGMAMFSVALTLLFMVTIGGVNAADMLGLLLVILMVSIPVTLAIAMPIAFIAWVILQSSVVKLSTFHATWMGLVAGTLLHLLFLKFLGAMGAVLELLPFAMLCGGGYGATFVFFFARWGGLKLPLDIRRSQQSAVLDRLRSNWKVR